MPGRECTAGILLVGAHYDSVRGCPAANDNGSGVAALLELARRFAEVEPACTVRFVRGHPLVQLTALIDWQGFEGRFGKLYHPHLRSG